PPQRCARRSTASRWPRRRRRRRRRRGPRPRQSRRADRLRALILFLLVAAAAVGVALFVRYNGGYVMFVSPPWRVELSQNAFMLLLVLAFLLVYGAIRLAVRIARLPQEVRAHRQKVDDAKLRTRQDGALIALLRAATAARASSASRR